MKIGFISLSITQSIPYITNLISLGYDVYPLIFDNNKNLINLLNSIVNENHLIPGYTSDLDCLIAFMPSDKLNVLNEINYNDMLKNNAPVIINTDLSQNDIFFPQDNFHVTNYNSLNIANNCNNICSTVEKVLQKNSTF